MKSISTLSANNLVLGLFLIISFILFPFSLSLLIIFFVISFNQLKLPQLDRIAVNILAIYLSLINSTKTPEADMENYLLRFKEVPETTFLDFIFFGEGAREPVFSFLNYIGYYLSFGSFQFFIFLVSFMIFSIQFTALRKYCSFYKVSSQRFFLCCLILGMLNSYFSLTGHLIRQCLGASILIYVLVVGCTDGKLSKSIFAISVFIHSIVLIFTPIILFKKLNQKIDFTMLVRLSFAFLFLFFTFDTLVSIGMSLFEPIQIIYYLFSRLADPDSFIEIGIGAATSSSQGFMTTIAALMLFYTLFILYLTKYKLSPLIGHTIIFCCLLTIFLSEYSLLQYRIFFLLYGFVPYLIVSIPELKYKFSPVAIFLVSIIIFSVFLYELENGAWEYASYVDLLIQNPLTLSLKHWL